MAVASQWRSVFLTACHGVPQQMAGVQFKTLAHAVAPAICGQELLKAGILLTLLGGVRKGGGGGAAGVPLRGDIHVLMVGDPGLGKSQLLQVPRLQPAYVSRSALHEYSCAQTALLLPSCPLHLTTHFCS